MKQSTMLYPGDLVEVKAPHEILPTLTAEGTLNDLPFMPEMLEFCGMRFRVDQRVVKTCCYTGHGTHIRSFKTDDVVTLEGLRCSGADHGDCPKACTIFWRESWLRRVERGAQASRADRNGDGALRSRLKTMSGPANYFCQASELIKATRPLSPRERLGKSIDEMRAGNCSVFEMSRRIAIWLFWRIRRRLRGEYARGPQRSTPVAGLGLRPGDWVEVKSMPEIRETVSPGGRNRGLYFSPDMRLLCGTRHQVRTALDKIIVDGSGQVRKMNCTVFLEGSICSCSHAAFGGCSRNEFVYWREIWLRPTAK